MARLDVPTWDDPTVAGHINALFPNHQHTAAWGAITTLVDTVSAFLRMFSQTAILFSVLRGQRDGQLLALLSFVSDLVSYIDMSDAFYLGRGKKLAANVSSR